MVDTAGNINTIAGNGTPGLSGDGGPATAAMLYYPGGVAFDGVGNVFIADGFFPFSNNRVREVFLVNPVQLTAVVSRKTHDNAGPFMIDLPLSGPRGIECRSGGANGGHTLVFTFVNPLTSVGGATVSNGTGSVSSSAIDSSDGRNYIVNLTGVTNAQTITVSLANVSDSAGNSSASVSASMGLLLGDVNASRVVTGADVNLTKLQQSQSASETNFRTDVNTTGVVTGADVNVIRQNQSSSLP